MKYKTTDTENMEKIEVEEIKLNKPNLSKILEMISYYAHTYSLCDKTVGMFMSISKPLIEYLSLKDDDFTFPAIAGVAIKDPEKESIAHDLYVIGDEIDRILKDDNLDWALKISLCKAQKIIFCNLVELVNGK